MVKIKSIKFIGIEDVYNLEVEEHHNFSINGGLIVHNCDSLRYLLMSRPRPSKEIAKNYIVGGVYLRAELKANGLKDWEIGKLVKSGMVKLIGK